MILTINKIKVDLTKDVLDGLNPTFSLLNGRRFSLGNQDLSLNQTIRLVRKEVMTSPSEDLGELIAAFNEMKDRGYKGKEIDSECFLVSVVTKIKHYFSKKTTNKLIKSLDKYVIQSVPLVSQNKALEKHEIMFNALNLISDNKVDKINTFLKNNICDDEIIGHCLTWAVRNGTPEMVDIFLPLIKDLNALLTGQLNGDDVEGETILISSIPKEVTSSEHLVENIKKLLQSGADANIPDKRGHLPIHRVLMQKHINKWSKEIIGDLIPFTKDINSKDNEGNTVLSYAAFREQDLINMFIENGADANVANLKNVLPLHFALSRQDTPSIDHVKKLIEETTDINSSHDGGYTPLHMAAEFGFFEIVNLLLENGADPSLTDISGKTPCQLAQSTIDEIKGMNEEGRAAFISYHAKLRLPNLEATVERLKA